MIAAALTIAGSDSGGGAGIQADLKTFHSFGVFGTSAIAALTAQNTRGVVAIHDVPASFVAAQIDAVLSDIPVAAAKTGMLSRPDTVEAVADRLRAHSLRALVVDPVMVAKSGARLLSEDAVTALRRALLPLALLVTPNAAEAQVLAGGPPVRTRADMEDAARRIADLGPRAVLLKGGHLAIEPGVALDLLHLRDTGESIEFRAPRQDPRHTHGTGCTLSAAIAAGLALGKPLPEAVAIAKDFLTRALAAGIAPGSGHGCPDHRVRPALAP